jgi:hypothetical protein
VLPIEPAGDDGGDEELGAVAVELLATVRRRKAQFLRVGSGIGHGEESRLGVLAGEVLIGELLTVDRLPTCALYIYQLCRDTSVD